MDHTSQPSHSVMPFDRRIKLFQNIKKVPLMNLFNLVQALQATDSVGGLQLTDTNFLGHLRRKIDERIKEHQETYDAKLKADATEPFSGSSDPTIQPEESDRVG